MHLASSQHHVVGGDDKVARMLIAPVYTVRGFAPGGKVWKLSFVVTLNPGENRAPTRPAPMVEVLFSLPTVHDAS